MQYIENIASVVAFMLPPSTYAMAQPRHVEWSFENRTNWRVDFSVNGHFACSANPMSTCTSTEQNTDVHLEAFVNGSLVKTRDMSRQQAEDGGYDWIVCIVGKTCPTN